MNGADIARALVVDAIDTAGEIRENVAHLRELGKRAAFAARAAGQVTRARFEGMIDAIADRIAAQQGGRR